jgi:hypothetical protein
MRKSGLVCTATVLAFIVASCRFPQDDPASSACEKDPQMCPRSSKAATSVTCDCKCTVGLSDDTGDTYEGHVPVCLPPELNVALADGEVRSGLSALDARVFDQRVFDYCSQDVARFLRTTIKAPVGFRACAVPLHCECTTKGALRDSSACHADCQDVACTQKNCPGVLWKHSKLDTAVCRCSRSTACGTVSPVAESHAVCHDWATVITGTDNDAGAR